MQVLWYILKTLMLDCIEYIYIYMTQYNTYIQCVYHIPYVLILTVDYKKLYKKYNDNLEQRPDSISSPDAVVKFQRCRSKDGVAKTSYQSTPDVPKICRSKSRSKDVVPKSCLLS